MRDASQVRVFYTAPTLIRSLMQHGDEPVKRHDLSSLRVLGTVGEPIGAQWKLRSACFGVAECRGRGAPRRQTATQMLQRDAVIISSCESSGRCMMSSSIRM